MTEENIIKNIFDFINEKDKSIDINKYINKESVILDEDDKDHFAEYITDIYFHDVYKTYTHVFKNKDNKNEHLYVKMIATFDYTTTHLKIYIIDIVLKKEKKEIYRSGKISERIEYKHNEFSDCILDFNITKYLIKHTESRLSLQHRMLDNRNIVTKNEFMLYYSSILTQCLQGGDTYTFYSREDIDIFYTIYLNMKKEELEQEIKKINVLLINI